MVVSCILVISLPKQMGLLVAAVLLCLVCDLRKPSLLGLEPSTFVGGGGVCSCSLLTKTNKSGLGTIFLLYVVSELQKLYSPGLKPSKSFGNCVICSCNLPAKTTLVLAPFFCFPWFPN
jgi:hypothetical protein